MCSFFLPFGALLYPESKLDVHGLENLATTFS